MSNIEDHARLTDRNRLLMTEFADLFWTRQQYREGFERFMPEGYIQHNPRVADGRAAGIAFVTGGIGNRPHQFKVLRILVDGNMTAVHLHLTEPGDDRGKAVIDMYRIENGQLVEHWDIIQPVPETTLNSGMF